MTVATTNRKAFLRYSRCTSPRVSLIQKVAAFVCYLFITFYLSDGFLLVPGLRLRKNPVYAREAAVNIGSLVSVHQMNSVGVCSAINPVRYLTYKAMDFAVDQINQRHDLLPNITVGSIQLDDCGRDLKALEVSMYFVKGDDNQISMSKQCTTAVKNVTHDTGKIKPFNVVGVLGPDNSVMSVAVSKFLGTFQLPVMATYATANELSDKAKYPYFMRLVPSDLVQQAAIIEVAHRMGWTYISMVYSAGAYGDGAAADIQNILRTTAAGYGICLAVMARIPSAATAADYDEIVDMLAGDVNARVVIAYVQNYDTGGMFDAVRRLNKVGWFMWLASDSIGGLENSKFIDTMEGLVYTDLPETIIPRYQEYIWSLSDVDNEDINKQTNSSANNDPWFREYWQYMFNCSSSTDCGVWNSLNQSSLPIGWNWNRASRTYDGVYVYAHAIHNLVADTCPDAFAESTDQATILMNCLDGKKILNYLKNTSISGVIGEIKFNSNGDMAGDVILLQYQKVDVGGRKSFVVNTVGKWRAALNRLDIDDDMIDWSRFLRNADSKYPPIKSVCSEPCPADEYVVQLAVSCCWRCEKCRENEVVNANRTGCVACPLFTFPEIVSVEAFVNLSNNINHSNQTTSSGQRLSCVSIPVTVLRPGEPLSVVLVVLAAMCAVISLIVIVVYAVQRHHRLIKATSRELSAVILSGTLLACATVVSFTLLPSGGVCIFRDVGFHISINLLYAPLLVKTLRTYRIFAAAKSSVRMPACVSAPSQMMITVALVMMQAGLVLISQLVDHSVAAYNQPSLYVKYVELYCYKSIAWFLIPLAYNMALMVVCAVLGFLSRHLPENFNDSQFIFVSVATTLFVWILFVPAYFTAYYAYLRSAIIGFCLVSNIGVTLFCQFIRIVYAVFFVPTYNIRFNATVKEAATTTIRVTPAVNPAIVDE